jgi:large subunit ribosomal protein L30
VTQIKSTISHIARNRATIRALGLHRIGDVAVVPDNDATRGMVRAVRFLVSVEEVEAEGRLRTRGTAKAASAKAATTDHADKAVATRAATDKSATTDHADKAVAKTTIDKTGKTDHADKAVAKTSIDKADEPVKATSATGPARAAPRAAPSAKGEPVPAAEEDK